MGAREKKKIKDWRRPASFSATPGQAGCLGKTKKKNKRSGQKGRDYTFIKEQRTVMRYLYIIGTILFTVYGQLVIKWQMSKVGPLPEVLYDKILFLISMFLNLWIISAFLAAFLAALCWMGAMTKFDLSYAYPFMSLSFVLVLIFSGTFFHEAVNMPKVIGIAFIVFGIIISSNG